MSWRFMLWSSIAPWLIVLAVGAGSMALSRLTMSDHVAMLETFVGVGLIAIVVYADWAGTLLRFRFRRSVGWMVFFLWLATNGVVAGFMFFVVAYNNLPPPVIDLPQ